MQLIAYIAGYLYLALGLSIMTDGPLMDVLEGYSTLYKLPPSIAGATILAVSSSAPELATSWIDTFGKGNHIGVGTIIGSAIFNLLCIIGGSAWAAPHTLQIDEKGVKRDIAFYTLTCCVFGLTVLYGKYTPWNMWTLLTLQGYYVMYLAWQTKKAHKSDRERNYNRLQSRRTWTTLRGVLRAQRAFRKALQVRATATPAVLNHGASVQACENGAAAQVEIVIDVEPRGKQDITQVSTKTTCGSRIGTALRAITTGLWENLFYYTTPKRLGLGFLACFTWTILLTYGLVFFCEEFAVQLGISPFWAGILLLAPTTSLPDFMASVEVAKKGQGDMAVANAISSNIFDIAVGLGSANLCKTLWYGDQSMDLGDSGVRSFIALAASITLLCLTLCIGKSRLGKLGGTVLIVGYVYYVILEVTM